MSEVILRQKEVLEMLKVDRSTLYRWIQNKRFPAPKKIGPRAIGWPERKVKAWMDARPDVEYRI